MYSKMKQFKVIFMVVSLLLVGLVIVNGCKKEEPTATETTMEHEGHEKMAMAEKTVEAVAASLEQKTCPVMGAPINKELFVEYKGKKVYFCCPGCEDKFKAEPEKYIAKLPQFQQKTQ